MKSKEGGVGEHGQLSWKSSSISLKHVITHQKLAIRYTLYRTKSRLLRRASEFDKSLGVMMRSPRNDEKLDFLGVNCARIISVKTRQGVKTIICIITHPSPE